MDKLTPSQMLLLLLIKYFNDTVKNGYLGRTAVQKLVYFSKQIGVPFSYRFDIHFYGPYSEKLAYDLEDLQVFGFIEDISRDKGRYSKFKLTEKGVKAVDILSTREEIRDALKLVASEFGKLDPVTLELLTTVHFVALKVKLTHKEVDENVVIQQVKEFKGKKFDSETIFKAFKALKSIGLI